MTIVELDPTNPTNLLPIESYLHLIKCTNPVI